MVKAPIFTMVAKKSSKESLATVIINEDGFLFTTCPHVVGDLLRACNKKESSEVCQTPKVCQDLAMNELSKTEIDEKNRALVRFLEKLVGKDAASIQVSDVRISDLDDQQNRCPLSSWKFPSRFVHRLLGAQAVHVVTWMGRTVLIPDIG